MYPDNNQPPQEPPDDDLGESSVPSSGNHKDYNDTQFSDDVQAFSEELKHLPRDYHLHIHGDHINIQYGEQNTMNIGTDGDESYDQPSVEQSNNCKDIITEDDFEKWFFNLTNQPDGSQGQVHVLLSAIFAKNDWMFIRKLRQIMHNEVFPSPPLDTSTGFTANGGFAKSGDIFQQTCTLIYDMPHVVESGKTTVETVVFAHPQLQELALEFLRLSKIEKMIEFREKLSEILVGILISPKQTLDELSVSMPTITRLQTAYAIGEFARTYYPGYLTKVIRPLANSRAASDNEIVSWILFALYQDDEHKQTVLNLVKHWANTRNNEDLQTSAAFACSKLGFFDLASVMDIMRSLLIASQVVVRVFAQKNLFILYATSENAHMIIDSLAAWVQSAQQQDDRRAEGFYLGTFVSLITGTFKDVDYNEDDESDDETAEDDTPPPQQQIRIGIWQLIAKQQDKDKQVVNSVRQLVIATNNYSVSLGDKMSDVLQSWIQLAERDRTCSQLIIDELTTIASEDRSTRRTLCYLTKNRTLRDLAVAQQLRQNIMC